MAETFGGRIRHAWNAFIGRETNGASDPQTYQVMSQLSSIGGGRPDRPRTHFSVERTMIASIYTTLSVDVSSVYIRHVRLDDDGRYLNEIDSYLNECLSVSANIDQVPSAFIRDIAITLFDKGTAVVVPVDTTISPITSGSWDIQSMRVGTVTQWYPEHVRVSVYNQKRGEREDIIVPKTVAAIIENPFYSVMNEPNSTLKRLNYKLNLLDSADEQQTSGKLDIIIQLPFTIRSETRRNQAEQRRKDIEFQLSGSKYGIAYTDGTERITQLNRPVENNLLPQITSLTEQLYNQLGLTDAVLKGTADEATMLNYYARTIQPIVDAIVESMRRTFLTKTARSQHQSIMAFRDPFKLVPVSQVAEIADKFTRNEIATSNEIRQAIGWKPARDPKADELRNSNMPQPNGVATPTNGYSPPNGVDRTRQQIPLETR